MVLRLIAFISLAAAVSQETTQLRKKVAQIKFEAAYYRNYYVHFWDWIFKYAGEDCY